jgi:hypothetical protein
VSVDRHAQMGNLWVRLTTWNVLRDGTAASVDSVMEGKADGVFEPRSADLDESAIKPESILVCRSSGHLLSPHKHFISHLIPFPPTWPVIVIPRSLAATAMLSWYVPRRKPRCPLHVATDERRIEIVYRFAFYSNCALPDMHRVAQGFCKERHCC